jgi:hypothetical protein
MKSRRITWAAYLRRIISTENLAGLVRKKICVEGPGDERIILKFILNRAKDPNLGQSDLV